MLTVTNLSWLRMADSHRTLYHSLGEYVAVGQWTPNTSRIREEYPTRSR